MQEKKRIRDNRRPSEMLNAEMPILKNGTVQMAMRFTLAEAPKAFSNRIANK